MKINSFPNLALLAFCRNLYDLVLSEGKCKTQLAFRLFVETNCLEKISSKRSLVIIRFASNHGVLIQATSSCTGDRKLEALKLHFFSENGEKMLCNKL